MEQNKLRCPHCGAPQVRPDVRFCNYCGQPLAAMAPRSPAAPAGRRTSWLWPAAAGLGIVLVLLAAVAFWLPTLRRGLPGATRAPSATAAPTDTAVLAEPSAVPGLRLRVSTGGDLLNVLNAPSADASVIASAGDGFTLDVLGRTEAGDWFLVRLPSGLDGWVEGRQTELLAPLDSIPVAKAEPVATHTPAPTETPAVPTFVLEHQGCIKHAMELGQVKGQVFDREGKIIAGAEVEVLVEGQAGILPVGRSNADGWYEFIVQAGQKVRFKRVTINGRDVALEPADLEVKAESNCFQRVDIRER